jgi:hypothetical protein
MAKTAHNPPPPPTDDTPPTDAPQLLDLDDVPPEHRGTVTGQLRNGMTREQISDVIANFLATL